MVDTVNERLNGLVTLLKAVGVDDKKGMPDARQLDDDQIEAIIKKLQMAQSEAPQIIAALEAQVKQKKQDSAAAFRRQQQQQQQEEEDEEGEEEDSFDEDANYPMVGAGVSDDISVVSDLTTPTVLVGIPVPEEEHYKDTLPPMIVGGGSAPPMLIAPTKRKNLVGNRGLAPPRRSGGKQSGSGAAAQRRKHYNATMEKLSHDPQTQQQAPSSQRKQSKPPAKKKPSKPARRASMANAPDTSWGESSNTNSWNAFENTSSQPKQTLIDDNGFLMTTGDFDPFAKSNPFKSKSFGGSVNSGDQKESSRTRRKKKSSSHNASGDLASPRSTKPSTGSSSSKPRRSRRASLAM